jgi:menaquinone-dependent protoporphyrinogen IX oxidase
MDTKVRDRKDGGSYDDKEVTVYSTQIPDATAVLAMQYLERWSMVAAMPDGEDSSGRAKLRLPTTEEVVARAYDIAERAVSMAKERGHVIDVPDLNEINAPQVDDQKKAAE